MTQAPVPGSQVPLPPGGVPPQPNPYQRPYPVPPRRFPVFRVLLMVVLIAALSISILLNLGLMAALGGQTASSGYGGIMQEQVLEDGVLGGDQRVAVVTLEGVVDAIMQDFAVNAFAHLENDLPGAIVVRVNSPGGSPTASDKIWRLIDEFQTEHNVPVIASFGAIAASGGYYLAAGCDQIVAEELGITGSIGVITQAFTLEGTLEKLGMTPEVLVADASPQKDVANTVMRSWNDADRAKVKMLLNHYYDAFVDRVATGRAGKVNQIEIAEVCNGDIYTARQAVANGLVDELGYLEDAIAIARTTAGLSRDSEVVEVVRPLTVWEQIMGSASDNRASVTAGLGGLEVSADRLRAMVRELTTPEVLYLAPLRAG